MRPSDLGLEPLLHPAHAILLAFPIALFTSGLASDIAYLNSAEIQWTNFSAWLIAGGALFGGIVLAWSIVTFVQVRSTAKHRRALTYLALVAAMWVAGLFNSFHHSHDAWSSVGAMGILLSAVSMILALAAGWVGYSTYARTGDVR